MQDAKQSHFRVPNVTFRNACQYLSARQAYTVADISEPDSQHTANAGLASFGRGTGVFQPWNRRSPIVERAFSNRSTDTIRARYGGYKSLTTAATSLTFESQQASRSKQKTVSKLHIYTFICAISQQKAVNLSQQSTRFR